MLSQNFAKCFDNSLRPAESGCPAPRPRTLMGMLLLCWIGLSSPTVAAADEFKPGCVLIDTGQVLRGRVVRDGSIIQIQRGQRSEISLPARRVLHIADNDDHLYRFVRRQNPPHNVAAAVQLIRWSIDNGLLSQAAAEWRVCQTVFPNAPELTRLKDQMEPIANVADRQQSDSASIQTVSYQTETKLDTAVDVAAESIDLEHFAEFKNLVQPTLVARCGHCHGNAGQLPSDITGFSLMLPPGGKRVGDTESRSNYQQLLVYLPDAESAGRFLQYATTIHDGGGDPDFGSLPPSFLRTGRMRNTLYRLERWSAAAIEAGGRRRTGKEQHGPARIDQVRFEQELNQPPELSTAEPSPIVAPQTSGSASRSRLNATSVTRLPRVEDPHDPATFNQMPHRR